MSPKDFAQANLDNKHPHGQCFCHACFITAEKNIAREKAKKAAAAKEV